MLLSEAGGWMGGQMPDYADPWKAVAGTSSERRAVPAGWYADPSDVSVLRYWDGSAWTTQTAPLPSSATTFTTPGTPTPASGGQDEPTSLARQATREALPMPTRIKAASTSRITPRTWTAIVVAACLIIGTVTVLVIATAGKKTPRLSSDRAQTPRFAPSSGSDSVTEPTAPTTTTTVPPGIGGTITSWNSITLDAIVGPLNTSDYAWIQPDYLAYAFEFTIEDTGTGSVNADIYNDLQVFDSSGQGFTGDLLGDYTGGPPFPGGLITLAAGGSATGWVEVQVPTGVTLAKVVFTPGGYIENGTADVWDISSASVSPAAAPTTTTVPVQTIVYEVSGNASAVLLTYTTASGNASQESDASLPQTFTEQGFPTGSFYSMIVAAQGSGTSVTCTVLDDGQQISTDTGTGPYGSADCNGTVP